MDPCVVFTVFFIYVIKSFAKFNTLYALDSLMVFLRSLRILLFISVIVGFWISIATPIVQ